MEIDKVLEFRDIVYRRGQGRWIALFTQDPADDGNRNTIAIDFTDEEYKALDMEMWKKGDRVTIRILDCARARR